jgi:S-formylglutathione hydrolase FrmB
MLRDPEKFAAFGLFSGIKNVPDVIPEFEDREDNFYMFASAFGDAANTKNTEDDVVYMLKKQIAAGKTFPKGYMATGVEDDHYKDNVEFMDLYESIGLKFHRVIDHGGHNWEYCNRHVKKFLDWIDIKGTFQRDFE